MQSPHRLTLAWAALVAAVSLGAPQAEAQLRIVSYNAAIGQSTGQQTARAGMDVILQAIGAEVVNGITKPIDVLLLQEQFSMATSAQSLVDVLNGLYGAGMYARSTINAITSDPQGDAGGPGLVYNTQTVQLINELRFGTVNGLAQARSTMRYLMQPVGYDASASFYVYNSHYKADEGIDNQTRRNIEAQSIRANSDALGEGTHGIYAGDFNVYRSTEPMYQTLLAPGVGQAHDPINMPGSWHNSASFKLIHTQAPQNTRQFPEQTLTPGGMDDRFDFQLVTGEMLDGEGISYISGSYHAFGNNGTHSCCDSAITSGTGASPTVLNALMTVSDHLPVVADYQLPAMMGVQFGMFPSTTPVGAPVSIDVLVENIAAGLTAGSIDELDYTVSVTGDLVGGTLGTDPALGGGNLHQVMLSTMTPGLKNGTITVTPTSQSAAGGVFTLPVSYTVGGTGGGQLVRVPVARDDFDAPLNRVGFTQSPPVGAYSSTRGFQRFQVGAGSVPTILLDQSTTSNPSDTLGIIVEATKTDGWFGVADTEDATENPTGAAQATWQFDVADVTGLEVSIDIGAIGDFEADDMFNWTYALDGGAFQPLFASSVNEAGQKTYTFANGNMNTLQDPLVLTPTGGLGVELSNVLTTITKPISGTGDVLTLRLNANSNGAGEAYAFDNIVVTGLVFFVDADFNRDGTVDGGDLAAWRLGFSTAEGAEKSEGDADNDGDVDGSDFLIWQQQLGITTSCVAASAAVPEPILGVQGIVAVTISVASALRSSRRAASRRR